jgi:hypothetical protein
LVVDGRKFDGFSLALETDRSPAYGLLSGPVEPLKAAHLARWVKVELNEGILIDVGVLQVNNTGMAYIMLGVDTLPEILKDWFERSYHCCDDKRLVDELSITLQKPARSI